MYILLILFFISLAGIIFLIGRKVVLARNGAMVATEPVRPLIPDIQTIKYVVVKNTKRGGYTLLVLTVRFYIQSGNFLKAEYEKLKTRIINGLEKNKDNVTGNLKEKREVNKFLKMVSDYKAKIRHIKHKIIEEENSKN